MYDDILVPTDGSDAATAAADHAIELADAFGATVHALYVVDVRMSPVGEEMDAVDVESLLASSGERPADEVAERARSAGVQASVAVRHGVPHEEIVDYAASEGMDLVVMGTHGRTGVEHALVGSVAERVVRTADVPVLTVRVDGGQSSVSP